MRWVQKRKKGRTWFCKNLDTKFGLASNLRKSKQVYLPKDNEAELWNGNTSGWQVVFAAGSWPLRYIRKCFR
jgi:hypothetical protein